MQGLLSNELLSKSTIFGGGVSFNPFSFEVAETDLSIDTAIASTANVLVSVDKINQRLAYVTKTGTAYLNIYDLNLNLIKSIDITSILVDANTTIVQIILDGDYLYVAHNATGNHCIEKLKWNIATPNREWYTNSVAYGMLNEANMYLSNDKQYLYALGASVRQLLTSTGVVNSTWNVNGDNLGIVIMVELNGKYFLFTSPNSSYPDCKIYAFNTNDFGGTLQLNIVHSSIISHGFYSGSVIGNYIFTVYSNNGSQSIKVFDETGTLLSIISGSIAYASLCASSKGVIVLFNNMLCFMNFKNNILYYNQFTLNHPNATPYYILDDGTAIIQLRSGTTALLEKVTLKY